MPRLSSRRIPKICPTYGNLRAAIETTIGPQSDFSETQTLAGQAHSHHDARRSATPSFFGIFWSDFLARFDGPLHFRLFVQPLMAILFAVRDGSRDAREGRSAFLW